MPGLLSIVVPAYEVERYIDECLRSLSVQNYRRVEVIVVDDGSPDRSYDIALRWSKRDPRIRVVQKKNGGLSSARNAGVAHARGEFLAFLDSDDFVDRHAYQDAMSILQESGSSFAVMPYRRELKGSFPPAAPWIRSAHRTERKATTLPEFPDILVNAVAWSKVYRRDFWDRCNFTFPEGLLYEDQAISMEAFARAECFDVLSRVSINWRQRDDQSSITQQVTSARNIQHHHIAVRDSLDALEKYSTSEVRQERLRQILNNNLGEFLPNIRQMDAEAWPIFVEFIEYLLSQVTDTELWDLVDARKKILLGLVARENRELALKFLEHQGWQPDHFAGVVHGQQILGSFPLREELQSVLDDNTFVLSPTETMLRAVARKMSRSATDQIELTVIAYVDRIRPDDIDSMLFELVNIKNGERRALASTTTTVEGAVLGHTRRYADMRDALFNVTIPDVAFEQDGEYEIQVSATCGELRRWSRVTTDWKSIRSTALELADSRVLVTIRRPDRSVIFKTSTPKVTAEHASLDGGTANIALRSAVPLAQVSLVRDGDRFSLNRSVQKLEFSEGLWTANINVPRSLASSYGRVTYDLRVVEPDGTPHTVYVSPQLPNVNEINADGRFVWSRRVRTRNSEDSRGNTVQEFTSGCLTLVDKRNCLNVVSVGLDDLNGLVINCRRTRTSLDPVRATAHVGSTTFDLPIVLTADGVSIHVPLSAAKWGHDQRAFPSGDYIFQLENSESGSVALDVHDALAPDLPQSFETDQLRINVSREHGGRLGLSLEPPLRDDEIGGGNRWRMKDWFYTLSPRKPKSIVFRNLYGEAANDSALAVHKELQRRDSPLELIWAVRDHSIEVPDGARVVLEDSRRYYEAFGTADYVMVNVHQPDWYVKREGQILIETFHGYPFKLNGYKWWQKLGFTAERQESFFKRASEWDYLVSPASYATPFLKEFYRPGSSIESDILEIGYPRNDALLATDADSVRNRVRERLGIRPGQKAVLYAPTFRDYVSADDMSAAMVEFIDLTKLVRALGSGYVILLRGHPFNARQGTSADEDIINVTDYPDINDLILASDIGVLDYSSLRFDYALTGKPSLYYVPDFERYFTGRESFVPFEETAPGPFVRTAADLVESIGNADDVARTFEPQRELFVSRYMELEDGHATERLVDAVFASRGDA
ncbi:CDP-glycerol glycerophosphotransferase family protein [Microbacterium sp. MPKO10]|uniref:bifunctional glycosyltransferase/CDP-glycerol:glycerophosphate glycerophosphotransferase n=1 Tax=Microbacterium sp. MPKO10 TaxID=2989818 RepID=UPI0022362EFD|nr:CDP-glycerol glycerophosphotransferase family protein [Microbacterium sp. MPKO10]MCW4457822.1 CDP-glycerol glycerophosphotransferase family protein [Microbacterium sp. MPKO10]